MRLRTSPLIKLALVLAVACLTMARARPARALETDQFTVPPQPLADVGPHLQQHVTAILQDVMTRTNLRYLEHTRAAAAGGFWRDHHERAAAACLSEDTLAQAFFDEVGNGLPECEIEQWVVRSHFPVSPAKFDPSMGECVYGDNFLQKPLTLQELSPTVHLFGSYLGTDKVGHLFQQGHEYFEAYRKAEQAGADREAALRKAVQVGVAQETGFYGLLMVGVYSNGDLAANYAGLKFYLNLTRPIHVNGRMLPPIVRLRQNLWEFNPAAGTEWLRPFFSDHLNESLNPSEYSNQLRATVRHNFPGRAQRWIAFYHSTPELEGRRLKELSTWYGEDYGHSGLDKVTSVPEMFYNRAIVAR
jgi:hypothetical protein